MSKPIPTVIIVDPMGHGFGEVTAEMEVEEHIEHFGEVFGNPLKCTSFQWFDPRQIPLSTRLVLYDYGGMGFGNDLGETTAREVVKWALDHPKALVVVVSTHTFGHYVKWMMDELLGEDRSSKENGDYVGNIISIERANFEESTRECLERQAPFWFVENDPIAPSAEVLRAKYEVRKLVTPKSFTEDDDL